MRETCFCGVYARLSPRRNGSKDYKAREIFSGHGRHNSATRPLVLFPLLLWLLARQNHRLPSAQWTVGEIWMRICRLFMLMRSTCLLAARNQRWKILVPRFGCYVGGNRICGWPKDAFANYEKISRRVRSVSIDPL